MRLAKRDLSEVGTGSVPVEGSPNQVSCISTDASVQTAPPHKMRLKNIQSSRAFRPVFWTVATLYTCSVLRAVIRHGYVHQPRIVHALEDQLASRPHPRRPGGRNVLVLALFFACRLMEKSGEVARKISICAVGPSEPSSAVRVTTFCPPSRNFAAFSITVMSKPFLPSPQAAAHPEILAPETSTLYVITSSVWSKIRPMDGR